MLLIIGGRQCLAPLTLISSQAFGGHEATRYRPSNCVFSVGERVFHLGWQCMTGVANPTQATGRAAGLVEHADGRRRDLIPLR